MYVLVYYKSLVCMFVSVCLTGQYSLIRQHDRAVYIGIVVVICIRL